MKHPHVCYDRILPTELNRPRVAMNHMVPAGAAGLRPMRAAILPAKLWPNGSTLRVRFLEGEPWQHFIVKQYAVQWSDHAHIKFAFVTEGPAEIRIAFRDVGAWSYLGTDCLTLPADQPTMNFGWLDEGVVLHEFGHALGLIHEHQNPVGGIQWNRSAVYADLMGPPNNWSREQVDTNMFHKYSLDQVNGTALDPASIMLYAVPPRWTTDGFSSSPNHVLSDADKAFIGSSRVYPKAGGGAKQPDLAVNGQPVTAAIGQPGEEDLYTLEIAREDRYVLETGGETDVVMALYGPDSATALVARDDDGGQGLNARIATRLFPGAYLVQVRHYNTKTGTGHYTVRVSS